MSSAISTPNTTTGILAMWGGTTDGKDAYVDYANGKSNMKPSLNVDIVAEDMRMMDPQPSFVKNGYEFRTAPTSLTAEQLENGKSSAEARKLIEDAYFQEVKQILEKVTGGKEVTPYGFHVRAQGMAAKDIVAAKMQFGSLNVAHVDRDHRNAPLRLAFIVGEERAQELMKKYKRWASVNIWRPIGEPVQKWPLVFVNHDKVPDWHYETHMRCVYAVNDQVVQERGQKGHDTVLKDHPDYTYHYTSHLRPDEILIFSSFDSDTNMVAPHGAFWDNASAPDAPTRKSIEVRSWVFWDER